MMKEDEETHSRVDKVFYCVAVVDKLWLQILAFPNNTVMQFTLHA